MAKVGKIVGKQPLFGVFLMIIRHHSSAALCVLVSSADTSGVFCSFRDGRSVWNLANTIFIPPKAVFFSFFCYLFTSTVLLVRLFV